MSSWRNAIGFRARIVLKAAGAALLATSLLAAAPKSTEANPKYAAVVVDTATGKVLYERNADARRYPASLTKMMTLYVLFEDLERGRLKLGSRLSVSANAAAQAPSKLGLRAGQTIAVEDAIKALVTKSANDAAVVIAENVSGSVGAFAQRMTKTARSIGMSGSQFRNPNGLPNNAQYTTARDMMKLGVALQVRFPQYYPYFATRSFTYKGRTMGNHNRLLGKVEGVDGIKTGYINASGFNLVTSVNRDGRRLVAVVMGGSTAKSRDNHMRELIASYLPDAKRASGFASKLVAAVRNAPPVATGSVTIASAAGGELTVRHPLPPPRPVMAAASPDGLDPADAVPAPAPQVAPIQLTVAEPEGPLAQGDADDTANDAPIAYSESRTVRTIALPVPDEAPSTDEVTGDPTSAAEAFGDIETSSTDLDALAAIIDGRIRATAFDATEPPAPVKVAAIVEAEAPQAKPAASAPEIPKVVIRGWVIQIGAVANEADARKLIDKALAKAGRALAKADPVTQPFEKNSQTFVRARFAGFDSQKAAQNACAALKKSSMACFALRL